MEATPAVINNLEVQCLVKIFGQLTHQECVSLSTVQKFWKTLLQDDTIWRKFCKETYGLDEPLSPTGERLPSFRDAFRQWRLHMSDKYAPNIARTLAMWKKIEDWLSGNFPEVLHTLRPGAEEQVLDAAEHELHCSIPPVLRLIYRVHDGQELEFDSWVDSNRHLRLDPSIFHGLFGGYCFYQNLACTRMLSVQRMVLWTQQLRTEGVISDTAVVFAATQDFAKIFAVDCDDGSIHVHNCHGIPRIPAAPQDRASGAHDGVLRWMEEFGSRLQTGMYVAADLQPGDASTRSISLFPMQPPEMVVAVTQGVQVRASAILVPEYCKAGDPGEAFLFTYSIRFSLLDEERQVEAWGRNAGPAHIMQSCQLMARHWVIRGKNGAVESEVRGEAVVGKYPLLKAGGTEFVYQSCTSLTGGEGSMEGDFRFVEGSIRHPLGPEFDAICPRFQLKVPDYLY